MKKIFIIFLSFLYSINFANSESRFGELIGKFIFKLLDPFLLGKLSNYKSIHAQTIAKAMIHSLSGEQNGIFELHFKELVQHSIKFNNL